MTTSLLSNTPSTEADTERLPLTDGGQSPRVGRSPGPTTAGRFLVFEGPQDGCVALDRDVMHIGRGVGADVRIDDHRVSRRHAIIVRRPAGHRLLDDRSANGTLVNGRRVEQVELYEGDIIVLGRTVLRYAHVS